MPIGQHQLAFLRDPKGVAAITATSSYAIRRMVDKVDWDRARTLVEFGPGTGVLTKRLLERLAPDGRLLALETNAGLADKLEETFDDQRLTVVRDTAERVSEHLERLALGPVDYVFSGMPFFFLSPDAAEHIVASTHAALAEGGKFIPYQMFYLRRRYLAVYLEKHFSRVTWEVEFRNLPPYRVFEAVK